MNTIVGTWLLRMKTPIGTIEADYSFGEQDGAVRGSATGGGETVGLTHIVVEDLPNGQQVA